MLKVHLMFFFSLLVVFPQKNLADTARISTYSANREVPIQSWKTLRDKRVIKQNLDISCGAASIATLLTEYYRRPTTEKEVLDLLAKGNDRASFADMERVLPKLGFKGTGLATSWDQLVSLKLPVIVFVRHRKIDHFAVLRGFNGNYVNLADPSLGNRTLTRGQFRKMWETRGKKGFEGKMLAVLPLDKSKQQTDKSFFSASDFSAVALERLVWQPDLFR